MEGKHRVCGNGRRRRRARSQATVEFAFVAPLFLLCFLATVDAGLWAVQSSAEVAAVQQAARLAASAGASPLSAVAPAARTVTATVAPRLKEALFAPRLVAWPRRCPRSPSDVEAVFGPRVVALCIDEHDPPPCTAPSQPPYCTDTPTITVRVIGFIASLVPPGFVISNSGGEIPADISATTHTLRFAP
jgi:hypothetical protein